MAKKSNNENVVEPKLELVCQNCKNHMNHPSKCKMTGKYVGRKQDACNKFKEGK